MFDGISCAFLTSFLVFHLNFLFIIRPARHLNFTILNLILIFAAFFVQIYYPNLVNSHDSHTSFVMLANILSVVYAAFVLYIGLYIMKRESDLLRKAAEDQTESLKEVARIQNQMISIISHDVRSPLANIEQMLQMITSGMIPEAKKSEFNKQLLSSTRQTREILESMVTWTRAQVSDLGVNENLSVTCDLDVVLRKELEDWEDVALQKNIRLSYQADCPLPALVKADQNLAKTVLRNLVLNALKFTPKQGQVSIRIAETPTTIQLFVKDNGIGMSDSQKETLFRGRLTSKKGTNGEKGSGLGLWIIADMLQRIQGNIRVESEIDQGSTFIASIPKANL
jgi:signal transduction histidine kinase